MVPVLPGCAPHMKEEPWRHTACSQGLESCSGAFVAKGWMLVVNQQIRQFQSNVCSQLDLSQMLRPLRIADFHVPDELNCNGNLIAQGRDAGIQEVLSMLFTHQVLQADQSRVGYSWRLGEFPSRIQLFSDVVDQRKKRRARGKNVAFVLRRLLLAQSLQLDDSCMDPRQLRELASRVLSLVADKRGHPLRGGWSPRVHQHEHARGDKREALLHD